MKTRTIAGHIRRLRSLMQLGHDNGSCVICRSDYGEFLKLLDAIESEAKRMQDALKPVLAAKREDCDCGAEWAIRYMNAVNEAQRVYSGAEKAR